MLHISDLSVPGSCCILPGDRGDRKAESVLSPMKVHVFKRIARVKRDAFCSMILHFPAGTNISFPRARTIRADHEYSIRIQKGKEAQSFEITTQFPLKMTQF